MAFRVGDLVEKVGGRYGGPGRIVGISAEVGSSGYTLYLVAHRVEGGFGEFVHVYPASNLVPLNPERTEHVQA